MTRFTSTQTQSGRLRQWQPFGYTTAQRTNRDVLMKEVGPRLDKNICTAIALGKEGGRVFVVTLHQEDGSWREHDTDLDQHLAQLERHVSRQRATGCLVVLVVGIMLFLLARGVWDDLFGVDLAAFRVTWVYGLGLAVAYAAWNVLDYVAQWRRYLRIRPQIEGMMQKYGLTVHELLARLLRPARTFDRTLCHFLAKDSLVDSRHVHSATPPRFTPHT